VRWRALLGALGSVVLAPGAAHADVAEEVARAQDEFIRAHGDQPIAAIQVAGLRRTRPAVVQQWIECSEGDLLSTCDLPGIYERLYRLAIFSAIDVAFSEQAGGRRDRLERRGEVDPLSGADAVVLARDAARRAGARGGQPAWLQQGIAIGGAYSNRGWYTLGGYNDPNIAYTNAWGSVHAFLGSGLLENDAPDGSIQQLLDMTRFDLEYSLGWTFWDRRLAHLDRRAACSARGGGAHSWKRARGRRDRCDAGTSGHLLESALPRSLRRRPTPLGGGAARLPARPRHAAVQRRNLRRQVGPSRTAPWIPGPPRARFPWRDAHPVRRAPRRARRSRTLPGSGLVGADRYASLSTAYQVPFLTVAPGTATGVVFGEVGRYARNAEPAVTYGGPGVGLRFYLKRVAIPAVGVDVGYEVGSSRVSFSIAVGYRPLR